MEWLRVQDIFKMQTKLFCSFLSIPGTGPIISDFWPSALINSILH